MESTEKNINENNLENNKIKGQKFKRRRIILTIIASIGIIAFGFGSYKIVQAFILNDGRNISQTPTPPVETAPASSAVPTSSYSPSAYQKERKDIKIHAIYITGNMAGSSKFIDHIIELSKTTSLNAVVVDVKEDGCVNYKSEVPEVVKQGNMKNLYNPQELLKKLHDNNIYVIGRVVCFRDRNLAVQRKDLAIKTESGDLFKEGQQYWLNAYSEEAQNYNIDIAKEAASLGFDEIQFDYVRFPSQKTAVYAPTNIPKTDAILNFLKKAQEEISVKMNTPIGADIFAIVIESKMDGDHIGQDFTRMGEVVDYIYPMVYPSHWASKAANGSGQEINGVLFTAPDLKPYEVVNNVSQTTKKIMDANPNFKAKIREYLQDFTADYLPKGYYMDYGTSQVNAQIKGLNDAGFDQWVLWDGRNQYSYDVFNK